MGQHLKLKRFINMAFIVMVLLLLYLSSIYNYLLFHTIAEIFSVCIAFTVFILTWNSSGYIKNNYLLLVGTAYLFIGFLDFFHTMAYKGMQIFKDYDYYANQLWIATRYLESVTLLIAFMFVNLKKQINVYIAFTVYSIITIFIMVSIFVLKVFPICFIDGVGLTPFKKISEYIICVILILSVFFLTKHKANFDKKVYECLLGSIIFAIFSELSFTLYIDNYGLSNLVGHYFKIFSFFLIYKSIIEKGVRQPYDLIFRELKANEKKICEHNEVLKNKANIDGLTGLFNHRYLYEKLDEESNYCKNSMCNLSVILLDIDHFKNVNDTYGHLVGDKIINAIGTIISEHLRPSDIAGRYGGEEFLIILPKTNIDDAYIVAEKIRKEIEVTIFTDGIKITISGGVAQYNGEKISELIGAADGKLYDAKQSGRNKIHL